MVGKIERGDAHFGPRRTLRSQVIALVIAQPTHALPKQHSNEVSTLSIPNSRAPS